MLPSSAICLLGIKLFVALSFAAMMYARRRLRWRFAFEQRTALISPGIASRSPRQWRSRISYTPAVIDCCRSSADLRDFRDRPSDDAPQADIAGRQHEIVVRTCQHAPIASNHFAAMLLLFAS